MKNLIIIFLVCFCFIAKAQPGDPSGDPDVKPPVDTVKKKLSLNISKIKRTSKKRFVKSKIFLFGVITISGIIYAKREDEK